MSNNQMKPFSNKRGKIVVCKPPNSPFQGRNLSSIFFQTHSNEFVQTKGPNQSLFAETRYASVPLKDIGEHFLFTTSKIKMKFSFLV